MAVFKNGIFARYNGEIINPVSNIAASVAANNFFQSAGITNQQQRYAVYNLVADLQSYSIWDKMKAIYPFVGQPEVTSSFEVNLKDPTTFRGTFYGTWSFANTGATPDGVTGYMDTGLIPSVNLSSISSHLSSYNNTTPNNGMLLGANAFNCLLQYSGGRLYGGLGNDAFINTVTSQTPSFVMVNRPSSSTLNLFRNNSKILENTSNNGTLYTSNVLELARYGDGYYQTARFAFASIGDGLTDTEAANFYTAVQRFQTTLGRQV